MKPFRITNSPLTIILLFALFGSMKSAIATPAPNFTLPTDSGAISLSQFKGKVVYLDFWASWCIPCRHSFPWLNEMTERYGKQGLVVVAVNLDKDKALMARFLQQYPAKFIVARDESGDSARNYRVKGMPSSYLISRNGTIQLSHIGFRQKDKAELESKIRLQLKYASQ